MSAIAEKFAELKSAGRAAFMPFLAAGDPDLETSMRLLVEAPARGADLIELGIPASDPIADGPVIQAAFTRALARGLEVRAILEAFGRVRAEVGVPVLPMVSASIVERIGDADFFARLKDAGFAGVIIPDLPPEDGADTLARAREAGLDTVLLAAPATAPERRETILAATRGILYYVSVAGITGVRDRLPEDMVRQLEDLKSRARVPVCLGFGVSTPEQAAAVARHADGVIVGSAIVRRIEAAARNGRDPVAEVGDFIAELARAAHEARG